LILSVVIGIKAGIFINKSYEDVLTFYNTDFPEFQFKNGILNVDAEMPIISYDEETKDIFVIDTSNNSDESIIDDYANGVFIFKDKVITKEDDGHTISTFIYSELSSQFGEVEFQKKDVERVFPIFEKFKVALYIIIFIGYFIFKVSNTLFLALVYGTLSLIPTKIMKSNLKFAELYKISLYSLTLPTLIGIAATVFGISIPFFSIIKFIIMSVYIILIIKSIKENIDTPDLDYKDITIYE